MDEYIENAIFKRVLLAANYILEHRCTVREAAAVLGYSKSTIHNDVHNRLPHIDMILYEKVNVVLKYNYSIKHIRGGEATRQHYLQNK